MNPIDALEPYLRQIAALTGREVDEESLATARAYCNERVPAATYVPQGRTGPDQRPDLRPRCSGCGKVAFTDQAAAQRSAARINARGREHFNAYKGRDCGNWHVGHARRRRR
jgi:hypothetical protein